MMRVFRKLRSLRILINALTSSIVPVLNAFVILLLVTSIYAVMATDLFGQYVPDKFGTFFISMFTLFQVATGDAWASAVTREVMDQEHVDMGFAGAFFTSYMLIVGIMLMNIVVAVLLDEFISSVEHEKASTEASRLHALAKDSELFDCGPLDPLMKSLSNFKDRDELSKRIFKLWERFDLDESGGVHLKEFNAGLQKVLSGSGIECQITPEDFEQITEHGKYTDENGEIDQGEFRNLLMTQLARYANRKISAAMARTEDDANHEQIFALKMLMLSIQELKENLDGRLPPPKKSQTRTHSRVLLTIFKRPMVMAFHHWASVSTRGEAAMGEEEIDVQQEGINKRGCQEL